MRARRLAVYLSIGLAGLGAAFFGWLYYDLYWRWRSHFDANGRYFDEQTMVVYHAQNSALAIPLVACVLWLAASFWFAVTRGDKSR